MFLVCMLFPYYGSGHSLTGKTVLILETEELKRAVSRKVIGDRTLLDQGMEASRCEIVLVFGIFVQQCSIVPDRYIVLSEYCKFVEKYLDSAVG